MSHINIAFRSSPIDLSHLHHCVQAGIEQGAAAQFYKNEFSFAALLRSAAKRDAVALRDYFARLKSPGESATTITNDAVPRSMVTAIVSQHTFLLAGHIGEAPLRAYLNFLFLYCCWDDQRVAWHDHVKHFRQDRGLQTLMDQLIAAAAREWGLPFRVSFLQLYRDCAMWREFTALQAEIESLIRPVADAGNDWIVF